MASAQIVLVMDKLSHRTRRTGWPGPCGWGWLVPCTILACRAHPDTIRRRVAQRNAQGADASEADLTVLRGQCVALEPLTAEEHADALTCNTDAPQALQRLLDAVRAMEAEL